MTDRLLCLDTSVLIKCLTPEELEDAAVSVLRGAIAANDQLVAPAWAWAEVGSVLRKKRRSGLLDAAEAAALWRQFLALPIQFLDFDALRRRAWEIAQLYDLATLYDAAFLACAEVAPAAEAAAREFWTADRVLIRSLGRDRPEYVRELDEP